MQFPNPIVNRLVIFGSDGLPDITLGPDPKLKFYNGASLFLAIGLFPPRPDPIIQFIDDVHNTLFNMELSAITGTPRLFMQDTNSAMIATLSLSIPNQALEMSWGKGTAFAGLRFQENTTIGGIGQGVATAPIYAQDPININQVAETWHPVAWQNGWSAFTGSNFPPSVAYRLMSDGTCMLRGIGQSGTKTDNTILFTLPSAYWPQFKNQFVANTDLARITIRLQVFQDGSVRIFDMAAAPSPALISFDGIRFPLVLS